MAEEGAAVLGADVAGRRYDDGGCGDGVGVGGCMPVAMVRVS